MYSFPEFFFALIEWGSAFASVAATFLIHPSCIPSEFTTSVYFIFMIPINLPCKLVLLFNLSVTFSLHIFEKGERKGSIEKKRRGEKREGKGRYVRKEAKHRHGLSSYSELFLFFGQPCFLLGRPIPLSTFFSPSVCTSVNSLTTSAFCWNDSNQYLENQVPLANIKDHFSLFHIFLSLRHFILFTTSIYSEKWIICQLWKAKINVKIKLGFAFLSKMNISQIMFNGI